MSRDQCTKEHFLRDIANHRMEVLMDNGLYRHLVFSDGTFNRKFNIVTVPGRLWYFGDMGSYTFCRLEDMFCFFRDRKPGELYINEGYWSSKLESYDRDGVDEYDAEETRKLILEHCEDWSSEAKTELFEQVDIEANDGVDQLIRDLYDFEHNGLSLQDCHEFICRRSTFRFVWCCYAIVWGIQQYDEAKKEVPL